jgi:thiosulfate/3-mercaptopyruvate sulfurtransferase
MSEYAQPGTLVSTEWVQQHQGDSKVALAEVDVDTTAYEQGHIPGAVGWNWQTQLCDRVQRDIIGRRELEKLLGDAGISRDTTIVLYGDNNNWFAAWAFWQLKMYGHPDVRLMNGGRRKWLAEGRPLTTEVPRRTRVTYTASGPDLKLRAFRRQVEDGMDDDRKVFVDVRSPDEFTGRILAPPGLPETCQRGGHIPGALNIPWAMACNEDGTFKGPDELRALYTGKGVTPDKAVVCYCRIGERSSHSWYVLKYLLGYSDVTNYDGSWTEWGNLVGAPIETGA